MPGILVLANEEEVTLAQDYLLICLDLFLSRINPSLITSHRYGLILPRSNYSVGGTVHEEELYSGKNCTVGGTV